MNILFVLRAAGYFPYASDRRRAPEVTFYRDRWRRYLPRWLGRLVEHSRAVDGCFGSPLAEAILTTVERITPASSRILAALRRNRPDCVVATPNQHAP